MDADRTGISGGIAPEAFRVLLARDPAVLFVLAPLRGRYSAPWTNLGVGVIATGLIRIFGLKVYLVIQCARQVCRTGRTLAVPLMNCFASSKQARTASARVSTLKGLARNRMFLAAPEPRPLTSAL